MKLKFLNGKSQRSRIFALVTVCLIVLLLALNLLTTYLGLHKSLYIDTTSEGLYSLTDAMKRECEFIDKLDDDERCVKITFCADPDTLVSSETTRITYFMALKLANRYENLEVETVNVAYNPTAVAKYKPTSLTKINQSDIIVSYGDRYRVVGANKFWVASGGEYWSYNGEYKMVSLIKSVTAVNRPAAYYVTNHGESYYDISNPESEMSLDNSYFYDLLTERGMEVKTLDLGKEEIPEDCVLIIVNNPKTDFETDSTRLDEYNYVSETEKLDRYLVKRQGAIMVSRDNKCSEDGSDASLRAPLPEFDAFLHEWGFDFTDATVSDDENHIARDDGSYSGIIAEYDNDDSGYGYAIYGELASVASAPAMVFNNAGYINCSYPGGESVPEDGTLTTSRNYASLFDTYDSARATLPTGELVNKGAMTVAATTTRLTLDSETAEYRYSYLFCANTAEFFSSDVLGNASYANYDVVSALVENMARIDEYASLELGGLSGNSPNVGGKKLLNTDMSATTTTYYDKELGRERVENYALTPGSQIGFTIALMLIPAAAAVIGIIVCVKRKFL